MDLEGIEADHSGFVQVDRKNRFQGKTTSALSYVDEPEDESSDIDEEDDALGHYPRSSEVAEADRELEIEAPEEPFEWEPENLDDEYSLSDESDEEWDEFEDPEVDR